VSFFDNSWDHARFLIYYAAFNSLQNGKKYSKKGYLRNDMGPILVPFFDDLII
jgi:hypothetical protein